MAGNFMQESLIDVNQGPQGMIIKIHPENIKNKIRVHTVFDRFPCG